MAWYHLEWPILQYDESDHVIEPCAFKKEPWSWKQGPPLIFDLLLNFYAIWILRKGNISSVFSISSGDDFYGWRRRQEIGKLFCWKWNHGNSQSQGSANDLDQSYSLGIKKTQFYRNAWPSVMMHWARIKAQKKYTGREEVGTFASFIKEKFPCAQHWEGNVCVKFTDEYVPWAVSRSF